MEAVIGVNRTITVRSGLIVFELTETAKPKSSSPKSGNG
jgi:hypothetical protein